MPRCSQQRKDPDDPGAGGAADSLRVPLNSDFLRQKEGRPRKQNHDADGYPHGYLAFYTALPFPSVPDRDVYILFQPFSQS